MPQIVVTIDVDDEIGDVSLTIDEVQAHGVTVTRNRTNRPQR